MSATMTMTMAQPGTIPLQMSAAPHSCPRCGFEVRGGPSLEDTQAALLDAQKQIDDLEAQVRLLNQKAMAAVERWADYEDELARLRRQMNAANVRPPSRGVTLIHSPQQAPPPQAVASPTRSSFLSTTTRLSSLLSPRSAKSTPNLKQPPPPPPPPVPGSPASTRTPTSTYTQAHSHTLSTATTASSAYPPATPTTPDPNYSPALARSPSHSDLLTALTREQTLRREAEGKLSATSREVEELSATLFEQANEMVAAERRARAKLEERVELLEKRDVEKRRRLERLEAAMERIERVRALLGDGALGGGGGGAAGPGSGMLSPVGGASSRGGSGAGTPV